MKLFKRFSEKPAGVINFSDLKTVKGQLVYWFFMLVLILVSAVCLIPALWTLSTGFKTSQEIYQSASFFPENLTLSGMKESVVTAWKAMNATRTSLNTLYISIMSTIVCIVVDGLGGYVLSRLKPTGSKLVFSLIVWTMMMPSQIRTVPLFISYMNWPLLAKTSWEVSLLNTYVPQILGAATGAFTVMLFKNNFDSISISLIEAAKIDGAGQMKSFARIALPSAKPAFITVALFSFVWYWNESYLTELYVHGVMTDSGWTTLVIQLSNFASNYSDYAQTAVSGAISLNESLSMAGTVLSILPLLLMYFVLQRHFVESIDRAGITGE